MCHVVAPFFGYAPVVVDIGAAKQALCRRARIPQIQFQIEVPTRNITRLVDLFVISQYVGAHPNYWPVAPHCWPLRAQR